MPNTLRIGASLNVSRENIDKAMDTLDDTLDYALTYLESEEWLPAALRNKVLLCRAADSCGAAAGCR